MAAKNTNKATDLVAAEKRRKELIKKYRDEEKVPMSLSPMYRPYVGNVMRVMINGISIFFKVDGTTQKVPKTFADEIVSRRKKIDAYVTKTQRMSDVSNNYETSPGDLKLF
jgi:hypothetical protein